MLNTWGFQIFWLACTFWATFMLFRFLRFHLIQNLEIFFPQLVSSVSLQLALLHILKFWEDYWGRHIFHAAHSTQSIPDYWLEVILNLKTWSALLKLRLCYWLMKQVVNPFGRANLSVIPYNHRALVLPFFKNARYKILPLIMLLHSLHHLI